MPRVSYDRMVVAVCSPLDGAEGGYTTEGTTERGHLASLGPPNNRGERMDKPTFVVHAYPVYVHDWRNSETRMRTTLEERAILWELIFWCSTEGSLPTSPAMLCKIADCSLDEFNRAWPNIKDKFVERGGRLHNDRVDAELMRITDNRERAAKSGKNGATRRWGGHGKPIGTPSASDGHPMATPSKTDSCSAMATPIGFDSYPSPSPSPNPSPDVCAAAQQRGPSLAPLSAAEWAQPDPGQEARLLVNELMKNHPHPGNLERAVWSVQRVLSESLDIPRIMASIRTSHEAWCVLWKAEPKRFRPLLSKWVEDGDYMTTPVAPVSADEGW